MLKGRFSFINRKNRQFSISNGPKISIRCAVISVNSVDFHPSTVQIIACNSMKVNDTLTTHTHSDAVLTFEELDTYIFRFVKIEVAIVVFNSFKGRAVQSKQWNHHQPGDATFNQSINHCKQPSRKIPSNLSLSTHLSNVNNFSRKTQHI